MHFLSAAAVWPSQLHGPRKFQEPVADFKDLDIVPARAQAGTQTKLAKGGQRHELNQWCKISGHYIYFWAWWRQGWISFIARKMKWDIRNLETAFLFHPNKFFHVHPYAGPQNTFLAHLWKDFISTGNSNIPLDILYPFINKWIFRLFVYLCYFK